MATKQIGNAGQEFGKLIPNKEKQASLDAVSRIAHKITNHTLLDPDNILFELEQLKPKGEIPMEVDFKYEYMFEELLSKLKRDVSAPTDTYAAAIESLHLGEAQCKIMNDNGLNHLGHVPHTYFERVMFGAQKIVSDVLSDLDFNLFKESKFSSGASTHRKKKVATPYHKYNTFNPVGVTKGAQKYARALITATPLWDVYGGNHNLEYTLGNQVFTVPKNSETDRAACKEPELNMALQLAVGQHIRSRLLRYGINLNNQCVNQMLALHGSQRNSLATIDLKRASDSISQMFVFQLLPLPWYELLNALRSPYGTYLPTKNSKPEMAKVIKWEKHSTMGNGYTFELETLLFYAISRSVTELDDRHISKEAAIAADLPRDERLDHSISVYGDDIIVPSYSAQNTISVLAACGFGTNQKKTFINGPFRESCGKHYYNGFDVSPMYIRKPIDSLNRVMWFVNTLRKWSDNDGLCDSHTFPLWLKLRRTFVPSCFLGGVQVESISSVASLDKPRLSLVEKRKVSRINGVPGVLQALQFMGPSRSPSHNTRMTPFLFKNREENTNWVKWYDSVEYDCDSPSHEFITVLSEKAPLTVIVNESLEIPFGFWLEEIPDSQLQN